jgi:hypothetical protein
LLFSLISSLPPFFFPFFLLSLLSCLPAPLHPTGCFVLGGNSMPRKAVTLQYNGMVYNIMAWRLRCCLPAPTTARAHITPGSQSTDGLVISHPLRIHIRQWCEYVSTPKVGTHSPSWPNGLIIIIIIIMIISRPSAQQSCVLTGAARRSPGWKGSPHRRASSRQPARNSPLLPGHSFYHEFFYYFYCKLFIVFLFLFIIVYYHHHSLSLSFIHHYYIYFY